MTTKDSERVQVWNTFFKLARDSGISLKKLQKPSWEGSEHQFSGGLLDDKKMGSLALIAWCFLALESRANHLLEELYENGALSKKEVEAIRFLRTDQKWALLPKLAGKTSRIDFSQSPHSCVAELSALRNDIFHVNYDRLLKRLLFGANEGHTHYALRVIPPRYHRR